MTEIVFSILSLHLFSISLPSGNLRYELSVSDGWHRMKESLKYALWQRGKRERVGKSVVLNRDLKKEIYG